MNESESLAKRVAERFLKEAMAVIIRGVPPGYNWGWFSREDQRMHLQVVDDEHSRLHYKVWLEQRGRRTFEPAGDIPSKVLRKLEAKVRSEREHIESKWTVFMIRQGWLRTKLSRHLVTLTAYPGSHNSFTRLVDLKQEFPGAYSDQIAKSWDERPPIVDLDAEHVALRVGPDRNPDHREHIRLTDVLWE